MAASPQQTLAFTITGPISRADLPGLCDRVCGLLTRSHPDLALVDVGGVPSDAVTIDALSRLQLAARRHNCQVRLHNASAELIALRDLMGLADVLVQ